MNDQTDPMFPPALPAVDVATTFADDDWHIIGNPAPLFEALSLAQSDFEAVAKDRTAKVAGETKTGKQFEYSYDYATLGATLGATMPALNKYGLTLSQPCTIRSGGKCKMRTVLAHKSGTYMYTVSEFAGVQDGSDAKGWQAMGKAITYARRYAGQAMLGVAPSDDDDANEPDGNHAVTQPRQQNRQAPPTFEPKASETRRAEPPKTEPAKPQPRPAPKPEAKQPELPGTPPKPPVPPPPKPMSDRPPPPKVETPPPAVQAPAIDPLKQLQQLALGKGFTMKGLRWACFQNIGRPEVYYPPAMTPDEVAKMLDIVGKMTREEAAEHCASVKDLEPPIKENK